MTSFAIGVPFPRHGMQRTRLSIRPHKIRASAAARAAPLPNEPTDAALVLSPSAGAQAPPEEPCAVDAHSAALSEPPAPPGGCGLLNGLAVPSEAPNPVPSEAPNPVAAAATVDAACAHAAAAASGDAASPAPPAPPPPAPPGLPLLLP